MNVIAAMIRMHVTVYDLKDMTLCYSPVYSTAKDPVNQAALVAINVLEGQLRQVHVSEVRSLVESGAYIVDVREEGEYAEGHLVGSHNIPLTQLRARMEEALGQITMACSLKGEKIAILEARKQLCWYLRGVSHAGYYKQQIVSMNTLADAEKIVRGIQRDLR